MATRSEIQREVDSAAGSTRQKYLKELAEYTKRPTILYASAFGLGKWAGTQSPAFSITAEDMQGFMAALSGVKGDNLDLILHSPGGSLEAAEQIVNYLRAKFKHIRAIIPQGAMSAATMLACACDVVLMGKQSALGPIDPQFVVNGAALPAHAILDEFKKAKAEITSDPKSAAIWIPKLQGIPPGFLSLCERQIVLSKLKVKSWLLEHMKVENDVAEAAASWLGDADEHKTHGRPINASLAKAKGLKIEELEADQILQDKVLSAYHATMVTFEKSNCVKIIENDLGKGFYLAAQK